jgi:hypothetical protein
VGIVYGEVFFPGKLRREKEMKIQEGNLGRVKKREKILYTRNSTSCTVRAVRSLRLGSVFPFLPLRTITYTSEN